MSQEKFSVEENFSKILGTGKVLKILGTGKICGTGEILGTGKFQFPASLSNAASPLHYDEDDDDAAVSWSDMCLPPSPPAPF